MSRIVKIIILSVIAGLLIALVAWGIAAKSTIYFSAGRLMFGEQAVQTEGMAISDYEADVQEIQNIRLNFVSESIDVVVTDGDTIRIEEKSSRPLKDDELMVCSVSGDTLRADSGLKDNWVEWFNLGWVDIQVTLYVPASYQGNFDLYSTSGAVRVKDVTPGTLKVNSTSGALYVEDATAANLDMGSTSGAVKASGGEYGGVHLSSVSGGISFAGSADNLRASSTSGAIAVTAENMPAMMDVGTVSGGVLLVLPENDGFTIKTDTVSGSVNNDFAVAHDMYKDGGSNISVSTVSGAISIVKK